MLRKIPTLHSYDIEMYRKYSYSKRLKAVYTSLWETHRRAMERHLPNGHSVTCHLTQVNVPCFNPMLDLPTPEGWKAELTLVLDIY